MNLKELCKLNLDELVVFQKGKSFTQAEREILFYLNGFICRKELIECGLSEDKQREVIAIMLQEYLKKSEENEDENRIRGSF